MIFPRAKKCLSVLGALCVLAAMAAFLAAPARYIESVRQGITLWAVSVVPAVFPFLFLTALFCKTPLYRRLSRLLSPAAGKLFRVSGEGGSVAVLAAVSGYPVGARALADLAARAELSRGERFRIACLSTTSGPMFLIGVVGSAMAGSAACGGLLLLCHFWGVWSVSFCLRFFERKRFSAPVLQKQAKPEENDLLSSVLSILCVGGSIALFSAFGQMVTDLFPNAPPPLSAAIRGLMEMTTGCAFFAPARTPLSLALCCFFVTFGGLCVLLQQAAYLRRADVPLLPFAAVKLLQGGVAGALLYGLAHLL